MNIRKEITTLSENELLAFQEAFSALQAGSGPNSYQAIAGLHGLPNPGNCPHHLPEFLPWHRLYLNQLELALQSISPDVTLPYWDWTSDAAIANGIPPALTDAAFEDSTGQSRPNPLFRTRIAFQDRWTSRRPGSPSDLNFLAQQVDVATEISVFYSPAQSNDFTNALELPHDWFHGWAGNDMSQVAFAAYDPIFWLHHCNIDRFWAEWQVQNPASVLPPDLLNRNLAIYNQPISSTLDFQALGYTDDTLQIDAPDDIFHPMAAESVKLHSELRKPRLFITVGGLKMTQQTFELRVFVNKQDPDDDTSRKNQNFAGSIFLLGMAGAMNPNGFMGEFKRTLEVAPTLARLGDSKLESVSIKAFDQDGTERPLNGIVPNANIAATN